MSLKEYLSQESGFSDVLNYAHFVDEGVIINKDGAFLVSYKFRGPDINSASSAELDALTANFNRMTTFLDDGWMLHVDELRVPSLTYPKKGAFPDSVSALIDDERRVMYESEGTHYENFQYLTFVWKFPLPMIKTARHWFVEGISQEDDGQNLTKLLKQFQETVERCVGLVSTQLVLEKLSSAEILSYLNTCISGELLPIAVPTDGCFLDIALSRRNVVGGYVPQIGNKYIYVLSVMGYLNKETIPGMLEEMGTYPLIYRWSNRFIPLSKETAEREIKRYQKNWSNKVKGFSGVLKEVISGRPSLKLDQDALMMKDETDDALTINSNGITRFGYWTSEIVLMNESTEILDHVTKELSKYLEQCGFACERETVNAFDAWLGTIPGQGDRNVRRMFVNAINFSHAAPLHSIWAGARCSTKSSLLPANSPPVFYAATVGKTPFRLNLDVGDVGHQIVLGPTGAGKTTFLQFETTQFFRYENAEVYKFDKDYSHKAETIALGGNHYDIGNSDSLAFCPLADLSTSTKKSRAEQFIEDLVELQNVKITPEIRSAIHTAMESLSDHVHENSRNITVFSSEVQNKEVRDALKFYTIAGQFQLLDATHDSLRKGQLHTFEMNWLLSQKPEIYLPVLRYIFDQIETRLEEGNGKNPTLIIIEEAWLFMDHPVFSKKLKDWLKTLRKKNARVVFATQSLADLYNPNTGNLTSTTAAIMESCLTKIFLPNPTMDSEIKNLYRKMGLTDRQVEIIANEAVPKRHYYVVTPEGNRLIDLGFTDVKPLALSFIGLSKEKSKELIECKERYGDEWVYHWLTKNGFSEWAEYWKENYFQELMACEA